MITLTEIFEKDLEFIKEMIREGKDLTPQLNIWRNDTAIVMVLVGAGRDKTINTIKLVKATNPDFISFISSGYMKKIKKEEEVLEHIHGSLAEEFEAGSTNVVENVMLQVASRTEKKIAILIRDKKKILEIQYPDPKTMGGAMNL